MSEPFDPRKLGLTGYWVSESAAARWERFVVEIAAELLRVRQSDEDVPPAGPLRDGPDTDDRGPAR